MRFAARRSFACSGDAEARAQGNSPGFRPKLPRQTCERAHEHQGVGRRRRAATGWCSPIAYHASPAAPISSPAGGEAAITTCEHRNGT